MSVRLDKAWSPLDKASVGKLAGQLGVFELGDESGEVVYVGYAGGRSWFGLKGEVSAWLGKAAQFRVEITSAYRTRHRELLMAHHADSGRYPELNGEADTCSLGRMSP